jgi:hypothetical protein
MQFSKANFSRYDKAYAISLKSVKCFSVIRYFFIYLSLNLECIEPSNIKAAIQSSKLYAIPQWNRVFNDQIMAIGAKEKTIIKKIIINNILTIYHPNIVLANHP